MRSVSSFPAGPVVLGHAVSMVTIGYCAAQLARKSTNCSTSGACSRRSRLYLPFSKNSLEATSRPRQDVFAGLVAGLADAFEDGFQRFLVAAQVGAKPPFVAHRRAQAAALEHRTSAHGNTSVPARSDFGEAAHAHGQDHEFLHVDVVVGSARRR
jgi:hypothetical protein